LAVPEKKSMPMRVAGSVSFKKDGEDFLGANRIELLEKIDQYGSITKAGKAQGISYKTAWEQVDALNNLADRPLVVKSAGGKGGGGTRLTDEGREVIRRYRAIQAEHERFLAAIGKHLDEDESFYKFLRRMNMKVSARNLWSGKVHRMTRGAINTLVELQLKGEDQLSALITNESVEALGLENDSEVIAMVKAPAVVIVKDLGKARISSCNILKGRISRITEGPVNSEVSLELPGGSTISATLTTSSEQNLGLAEADEAWALFQVTSVILGVL
jgi:molybdate transport system regulatory protein